HLEVTTLVIPDCNDSEEEITRIAAWLAEISPSIPLHLTRYYPNYRLFTPPTPRENILRLKEAAGEFLSYVYAGNI
ncbi:MAG: radical SAM protein, partial [Acidaminococcales bacterium]|nr:radical SAM protein [Acidaminococcales bacterium]